MKRKPAARASTDSRTFTWRDLDYTVKAGGKDLQLLNKVSGFCKAGTITALVSPALLCLSDIRWDPLEPERPPSWTCSPLAKTKV